MAFFTNELKPKDPTQVALLQHRHEAKIASKKLKAKMLLYHISDTPLIDHLVMREFVSGPPSYRFIYERVRDRKPSLRKGS
jgi:hypothetical protein